jgi:hypothetical protein
MRILFSGSRQADRHAMLAVHCLSFYSVSWSLSICRTRLLLYFSERLYHFVNFVLLKLLATTGHPSSSAKNTL